MLIGTNVTAHVDCLLETDPHMNGAVSVSYIFDVFPFVCRVYDSICGCVSVFELVSSVKASKQYSWMLYRCVNECKRKSDQSELHRTSCRIE